MLSRSIDRAALTALGAAGLYVIFLNAGAAIPVSGALAFAGTALGRRLIERRPRRYKATRAQAEAAVAAIATLPDGEALAALTALTGRADAVPALRHPSATLTADDVLGIWRANRGRGAFAIVATCPADAGAARAASALGVGLIDARALTRRVRETGLYAPPEPPPPGLRARLRGAGRALVERPPSLRAAAYGASLLGLYLATGRVSWLLAALCALYVTGARVIYRLSDG